jgi:hypothetical protein
MRDGFVVGGLHRLMSGWCRRCTPSCGPRRGGCHVAASTLCLGCVFAAPACLQSDQRQNDRRSPRGFNSRRAYPGPGRRSDKSLARVYREGSQGDLNAMLMEANEATGAASGLWRTPRRACGTYVPRGVPIGCPKPARQQSASLAVSENRNSFCYPLHAVLPACRLASRAV